MSKNRNNLFNSIAGNTETRNEILTRLKNAAEVIRNTWAKVGGHRNVPEEFSWAFHVHNKPVYGFRVVKPVSGYNGKPGYTEATLDAEHPKNNMSLLVEFVANGKVYQVPFRMLTNDPVGVAQTVRTAVKHLKGTERQKELADTKAHLEAAEKEVSQMRARLAELEDAQQKRAARVQRRAERIAYAKAKKAEEEAAQQEMTV